MGKLDCVVVISPPAELSSIMIGEEVTEEALGESELLMPAACISSASSDVFPSASERDF